MIRVLIVDDFEVVRRGLKEIFADEFPELEVGESANSQAALELVVTQEWASARDKPTPKAKKG